MSKLAQNYPTIRKLIYALVVLVCGGLVIAGIITEAESATYLAYIGSGLGALAAILASVNVTPATVPLEPVEYEFTPPRVNIDVDELAAQITQRWDQGVQSAQLAQAHAGETVADLRRRAEDALGHRLGD